MKVTLSEQKIFIVVWESYMNGVPIIDTYPCNSLEVAKQKVEECKNDILSDGHFAEIELDNEFIFKESDDMHYFIKDLTDDYYEDVYINESNLFTEGE